MAPENTLELTCPHCNNAWRQNLDQLEVIDQTIYRSISKRRTEQYRARCPACARYVIIDVQIEDD